MTATAYPLDWPPGWPRTRTRKTGDQFKVRVPVPGASYTNSRNISIDKARRSLTDELDRLGASNVIISTNLILRADGFPRADAERSSMDPGVAVYFNLKGKPMVMAQDTFSYVAANLRSLALAIEAMRSLERHGGGVMMERAFTGFTALPPGPPPLRPKRPWWKVMGYSENAEDREGLSDTEIQMRFKTLVKKRHPDAGGTTEDFQELEQARAEALADTNR